ncbi:L-iditol 2-dehydrogenase [Arthrobacter sp. yr096]|uniref:galactitol-1-phosphate 5-dehydrogenase n=1 Tax=Arthrobacter sp. yr096 TaxID=1761750 RepID=UPI0008CE7160|nr:galactitol-1-phosphate 5-dehydrogenase [Arthrobacter sp. yr096]SEJ36896.1 L-iditol 2-dehydrogenase [Arthrobacter sp. yr096]
MKAAILNGLNDLEYGDIPDPEPVGENPVLVRVGAVGVCGSDVLRFGHGKAYHYPLVLGHEFSAIVEEAPAGSGLKPGDRAAVFPLLHQHGDPMSEIGEHALGTGYDYFGSRRHGAMSERMWVPEKSIFRVPNHTPLTHAAMVEPAGVALHAMLKLDIPTHATALVIGAGPIGALAAQWLRILGCSRVLVADIDDQKLEIMSGLGFETLDAKTGDTAQLARVATDGWGPQITVEATGNPKALVQAIDAASVQGQVVLLGDLSGDLHLAKAEVSSLLRRELRLYGTWNAKVTPKGHSEWDMVIAHLGKDLKVDELISHVRPLEEAPGVFRQLTDRSIWYNKVLFAVAEEAWAEVRAQ